MNHIKKECVAMLLAGGQGKRMKTNMPKVGCNTTKDNILLR